LIRPIPAGVHERPAALTPRIGTRSAARKFLHVTGRIVSVKYYVSDISFDGRGVRHRHGFIEIDNPKNRFNPQRSWDLFKSAPPEWRNGVPPTWQPVMFFPTGKRTDVR
jgi:hypothetical protein